MFIAGGELATPFERRQEARVRALVERGEFDPILRGAANPRRIPAEGSHQALRKPIRRDLNRRRCEISQPSNCGLRSISTSARKSPANSADKASSRRASSLSIPCLAAAAISKTSTKQSVRSSATAVARRHHPLAIRPIEKLPDLAKAPSKLAARIVRAIPEKLAKAAAADRIWGHREIGDERAQLAGSRKRQRDAVRGDRQGAEHPDPNARFPASGSNRADSTRVSTPTPTMAPRLISYHRN